MSGCSASASGTRPLRCCAPCSPGDRRRFATKPWPAPPISSTASVSPPARAVGAEVRAEQDGTAGEVISRLRTALSGPLGALGDQLIWAGWVPALIGLALAAASWAGMWAVLAAVVVHNVLRFWVMSWGLDLGLREGLGVGAALQRSWLPRVAQDVQRVAAFAGAGRADRGGGFVHRQKTAAITVAIGLLGATITLLPATRTRVTGLRYGLFLVVAATLLVGGLR